MLSYIRTNFHLEKDEDTVSVQLSEEATEPHKGNSCLAAEELWKRTIVHNTVHSHLSSCCYSVEIQCIDIFIFFKVSNLL
jgi:regulator of PEP synthase PpsR (kinase-PPPase family)